MSAFDTHITVMPTSYEKIDVELLIKVEADLDLARFNDGTGWLKIDASKQNETLLVYRQGWHARYPMPPMPGLAARIIQLLAARNSAPCVVVVTATSPDHVIVSTAYVVEESNA